jgi:hypothetical protein
MVDDLEVPPFSTRSSYTSRRLPIWQLYERARSLGLAVQVSAQSWEGLAPGDDDRHRIAATADGGIWLLRTPHPEPVTALAGDRPATDTSRRLLGVPRWSHEGSSRTREVPVADPALIRNLGVGQVAYIYRGGVTFVQVKQLLATSAAVPPGPGTAPAEPLPAPAARAAVAPASAGEQALTGTSPGAAALLDEAFGAGPG